MIAAVGIGVGLYFGLRDVAAEIKGGAVVANGAECAQIGVYDHILSFG